MSLTAVFSTSANNQMGFGHFRRSLWLSKVFRDEFQIPSFYIISPHAEVEEILRKEKIPFKTASTVQDEAAILEDLKEAFLIIDKRDTNTALYAKLPFLTIGIDNYGSDAHYFDYNITPLPSPLPLESNLKGSQYLIFPQEFWNYQRVRAIRPVHKILVSFGGSDPADLSYLTYEIFQRIKEPYSVQIILGPLYQGKLKNLKSALPHIKFLPPLPHLYEQITAADLTLTSFGITAYESSLLGTPVFILNPSQYHEDLTKQVGFPGAGVGEPQNIEEIIQKLTDFIQKPSFAILDSPSKGCFQIKSALKQILIRKKTRCPACGEYGARIVKRNDLDNIYFCEQDRIFFRNPDYQCSTINYSSNYFVEDYQKQYGKTYEQDRPNIDIFNQIRLNYLIKLIDKTPRKKNLLEVGCALGFFLTMAQQSGHFDCEGAEISSYACQYAKYTLGLKVEQTDFLQMEFSYPYYDVIAMWYYIEHNQNLSQVIKKIKSALKVGGLLALSTPNADGITSRKDRSQYAKRIPDDHYFEFSLKGLQQLLIKEGFELLDYNITGVHPKRWLKNIPSFLLPLFRWLMKKLKIGDTFEAYFKRLR